MNIQIVSAATSDPSGLVPDNQQLPAVYYQIPPAIGTTLALWDVPSRAWVLYSPTQQVVMYSGLVPTFPPPNPLLAALAYDPAGGKPTFGWNTTLQQWK